MIAFTILKQNWEIPPHPDESHQDTKGSTIERNSGSIWALPMAHMKAYVPNFPKHMRERSQSLKLWVLDLSEVR